MSYNRPSPLPGSRPQAAPVTGWAPGQTTRRAQKPLPLARRYELTWLDETGLIRERTEIAPAIPMFEGAASAFTHGVLIATTQGEVPIEDLQPGMCVICGNEQEQTVMWKSSITIVPGAPTADDVPARLYRVTSDSLGPSRPSRDLVLGPAARRLVRNGSARQQCGTEAALEDISAAADGQAVIEVLPARPTRVYHLMTQGHATILANGLELETFHPGQNPTAGISHEMGGMFRALFPHIDPAEGFGRMLWPHIPTETPVSA